MIQSCRSLTVAAFLWLVWLVAATAVAQELPDLPPRIADGPDYDEPVADQPMDCARRGCGACGSADCCCEPRCKMAEPAPCCGQQRRGCCGRFWECWCRCWCGSFSYAAYGSPRMAANCCDGCRPQIFMDDMFCRCNTCNN